MIAWEVCSHKGKRAWLTHKYSSPTRTKRAVAVRFILPSQTWHALCSRDARALRNCDRRASSRLQRGIGVMLCMLQLTQPSFVAVSHSTAGSLLGSLRGVRHQTIVAKEAALPRDIKEVVNQMRASVQSALNNRVSRIDVDLPIGAEFGVEQGGETRKRGAKLTAADVSKSDREVARLFVEMFEGTGLRPLVLFTDEKQAVRAKELWPGVDARIAVLGAPPSTPKAQQPRKAAKKRSGGGGGGFGAPAASKQAPAPKQLTAVPPDTEVLFVVRPQGEPRHAPLSPGPEPPRPPKPDPCP